MEETELRDRLHGLAQRSAPSVKDSDELVRTIEAGVRTGRRRRWTLAAVAAALGAVLVAVPLGRADREPGPAAPTTTPAPVYTIPTRGGLSVDSSLVDRVRRLPWTGVPVTGLEFVEPPVETRHVVFVGDYAGTRWALVAAADSTEPPPPDVDGDGLPDLDRLESLMIVWFAGPSGGAPEDMTLQTVPRFVDAHEPTGLSSVGDRFVAVVAAPGDQIGVSPWRTVEADGDVIRAPFQPFDENDGIVVFDGGHMEASNDRVMRWRVVRDGAEFTGQFEALPDSDFVVADVDLARLRPAPPPAPGDAAVPGAIDDLYARLGGGPGLADWTVLWAGDLPRSDGGSARLTVLAGEFASGAVYLTGVLGWDMGNGITRRESCGSEIRPAGTPLDEQIVVVRCDAEGGTGHPPTISLVIVAPPMTTAAQAWDADDGFLGGYPMTDGVAVVPLPNGLASVEVVGADGRSLDRLAPMGTADLGN